MLIKSKGPAGKTAKSSEELLVLMSKCWDYDKLTGNLIWKISPTHSVKKGDIVGYKGSNDGYVRINLSDKLYLAHRLIWLMHKKAWPIGELDHINRNRQDNRLENLREVDRYKNSHNALRKTPTRLGLPRGVEKRKWGSFVAIIQIDGKARWLGTYKTADEAGKAYVEASIKFLGKHSPYVRG